MNTNNSHHVADGVMLHVKKEILSVEVLDEVNFFEFTPDDEDPESDTIVVAFALLPQIKAIDCIAQAAFTAYRSHCHDGESVAIRWIDLDYSQKQGWREAIVSVLENCGYMHGMAIPEPDLIEELSSGKDFPEI